MIEELANSFALLAESNVILVFIGLIAFEIPRYLLATAALFFNGAAKPSQTPPDDVSVSVVIAVHNGAPRLLACLESVRRQSLRPIEVIVVNDGSIDKTQDIAEFARAHGLITRLIRHGTRCGKSAALNHAIRFARGTLVLVLDDDTNLSPDAIRELAGAFNDEKVAVASGNLGIRQRRTLTSSLQAIEYLVSLTSGRQFLDMFSRAASCSGAFQMFRRDVYLAVGGMDVGPGEDLEITLRLRRLGYEVRFIATAQATIVGPTTFPALVRQRLRWDRDALAIRIFRYHNVRFSQPGESVSTALQRVDFVLFEFLSTFIYLPALFYLYVELQESFTLFIGGVYCLLFVLALLQVSLAVIQDRSQAIGPYELLSLAIFPIYQGLVMKLVKIYAFSTELFFAQSRRDDFVPRRVRRALYGRDEKLAR